MVVQGGHTSLQGWLLPVLIQHSAQRPLDDKYNSDIHNYSVTQRKSMLSLLSFFPAQCYISYHISTAWNITEPWQQNAEGRQFLEVL